MMPCLVPAIFFFIELAQSLNLSSNLSFLSVFLSSCVILGHIFLKGIDGRLDKVYLKTSILEDGIIILLFNALLTLSTKILGYEIEQNNFIIPSMFTSISLVLSLMSLELLLRVVKTYSLHCQWEGMREPKIE